MRINNKKSISFDRPRVAGGLGSIADNINSELELRRAVLACMLWEDIAYEDGKSVVDNIKSLVSKVSPEVVADIAIEARDEQNLRHVPLLLICEMAKLQSHKHLVSSLLTRIIQRPDEITEFLALYWKDGKRPLSNQVKKGLANSFCRFNEYQLAKYRGEKSAIKLRDVLFLTHPKPKDLEQAELWKKLANNKLSTPDTWETALSSGKDKLSEWTRLLTENKLGAMALLRNLRNMKSVGVEPDLINKALLRCNPEKVLPFRFITAAAEAPEFENSLETLMLSCLENQEKIKGKTVVIVDISGSMNTPLSSKSNTTRLSAAVALAILIKGLSESCVVYATSGNDGTRIASTKRIGHDKNGFALSEAIENCRSYLGYGGIFLKQCVEHAKAEQESADTLIVISDSQDTSGDESPKQVVPFGKFNYMMDISCHKHGVGYDKFTVLNGFSESLVKYIIEEEKLLTQNNS